MCGLLQRALKQQTTTGGARASSAETGELKTSRKVGEEVECGDLARKEYMAGSLGKSNYNNNKMIGANKNGTLGRMASQKVMARSKEAEKIYNVFGSPRGA